MSFLAASARGCGEAHHGISLWLDARATRCPALASLTNPADSCETNGLAKGLARIAADAADSPCIAI
jgi:hypothetical protein